MNRIITNIRQDLNMIRDWAELFDRDSSWAEDEQCVSAFREWALQLLGDSTELCTKLDEDYKLQIYGE